MRRLWILAFLALPAAAHESAIDNGVMRIDGLRATIRITLPASDFDRDGSLTAVEIDQRREAMESWIDERLSMDNATPALTDFVLPVTTVADRTHEFATVTVVRIFRLASAEATVRSALPRPVTLHLSQDRSIVVARSWILLGIEHVLTGWDHLLFLIALCLRGSKKLLLKVTAFTVGHSLTLALATMHLIAVPPRATEAAIAASIAIAAALSLRGDSLHAPWLALVFGLIHGLGFASAIASAEALVGFNVGVEIGQIAFVLAVLVPLRRLEQSPRWSMATASALIAVGTALAAVRIAG
jgi:hydrogenase/urease accessory protein HupE